MYNDCIIYKKNIDYTFMCKLIQEKFRIVDYMNNQTELTPRHRAIVINWLVVLQEMFGLNHEVLYTAVDLIDLYLMKNNLPKDKFQLLASAALLLSNKIDVSNK